MVAGPQLPSVLVPGGFAPVVSQPEQASQTRQLYWTAGPQIESTALASHGQHGSRVRHMEKCYMATKRKKAPARSKARRPSRRQRSPRVAPAAANEERFIFKFSFGDVPGHPVGCVMNVVAQNPGAALTRARSVLESMEMGVCATSSAAWPEDRTGAFHDGTDEDGVYDDGMDDDGVRPLEYARVYFGPASALTLNHVTMISELDLDGDEVGVRPGELTPRTNVRKLLTRGRGDSVAAPSRRRRPMRGN